MQFVAVKRGVRRPAPARTGDQSSRQAAPRGGPADAGNKTWEWIKSLLVAFALFLVIRTFLVEAFRIPTGSMEETLLVGDFLLVNKAVFGGQIPFTSIRLPAFAEPRRGDIAVFVPPHEPGKNYVKRLVAAAGDTVEMRNKALFINGERREEPYARHSDPNDIYVPGMFWQCDHRPAETNGGCRPTRDNWGPVVVPGDRFLMLGDNRDDSEDSRYWGFVDRAAIKGKPLFIYYSFNPFGARPAPWLTQIRWRRIGDRVR
jgi:signal peptidase I